MRGGHYEADTGEFRVPAIKNHIHDNPATQVSNHEFKSHIVTVTVTVTVHT